MSSRVTRRSRAAALLAIAAASPVAARPRTPPAGTLDIASANRARDRTW